MALVESANFEIGIKAPEFNLLDTVSGEYKILEELRGKEGTVIMFICNHCPYVIHVNSQLVAMANDYQSRGIQFIAISSNNVETHPQDGPEFMKKHAIDNEYPFPYLYDETQDIAKAYNAACTPDIYLFEKELKLVYHGQIDDSRPGNNTPCDGRDLRAAMDSLLKGNIILENQKPSIGCSIKWK